ncbi:hypothetical protein [Neomicrococcus aestuarii]|uniref:hypothetical protein n=1 Tax=Neomicrococcus aestuarii TaxID=556325 RepID=UPI0012ED866F|nr:hypothetical protein [Neomicrococcus aestuarii]
MSRTAQGCRQLHLRHERVNFFVRLTSDLSLRGHRTKVVGGKLKKSLALAFVGMLALTGCSSSTPPAASAPSVAAVESSASTSAAPASPSKSDRGNLIKEIGQPAGMSATSGEQAVNFVVKKIDTKVKCNSGFSEKPENGRFVSLLIDVETTKALTEPDFPGAHFSLNAGNWTFISKEGTTFNGNLGTGAAFSCLKDSLTLPNQIGTAQKASGLVVLDVPSTEGTLIFSHFADSGWEWTLGGKQPNA